MNIRTWMGRGSVRAVCLLVLMSGVVCRAQEAKPAADAAAAEARNTSYIRVHDSEDGDHVTLQVAIRSFKPADPKLPTVHLVGAVHIGDKAYYKSVQKFLDEQDLVLFEGVKPSGATSDLANANDAAKAKVTKSRQRFLAVMVTRYKEEHKALPESFDAMLGKLHGTMARIGTVATKDAWGNAQQLKISKGEDGREKFDVVSLGADGKEGGEGAAADLKFSSQKALTKEERGSGGEGIQVQLANAMGLEFQLVGIDYDREKWRNSDLTVDQLEEKLQAAGASGGALFSMLDGSSFMSKVLGAFLGFVGASPEMSMAMKTMMVETLANADEMMAAQGDMLGKGMGDFMKVLVIDRNEAVFADLDKVIKDEPKIRTVALFFGAGHLPDMEARLNKMGYTLSEAQWKDAIDIDLAKFPGGKAQAMQLRKTVRGMIENQINASKKGKKAKPEAASEKAPENADK
jgi:hypothetical protein